MPHSGTLPALLKLLSMSSSLLQVQVWALGQSAGEWGRGSLSPAEQWEGDEEGQATKTSEDEFWNSEGMLS